MTTAKKPHGASRAHSNRVNVRLDASEWEMFQRKAAAEGKEPNALLMEIIFADIEQQPLAKQAASRSPRKHTPFRQWQMLKHSTDGGGKLRSALQLKMRRRSIRAYRPAAAATGTATKSPALQRTCHLLSSQIQTVADVAGTSYLYFPWQMLLGKAPAGVLHPSTCKTAGEALETLHAAQRLGARLCTDDADFFKGCGTGFFLVRTNFCKVSLHSWWATVESVHQAIERNGFRPVPLYFATDPQPRMICGASYSATGSPVFASRRGAEAGKARHRAARVEICIPSPAAG